MLLLNPEEVPTLQLLENLLEKSVYDALMKVFELFEAKAIGFEWRYYNDGKAWLGKAIYRKKTVVWLSVWEGFIKTTFYFTEKNRAGVSSLNISENTKSDFANIKAIGKLIPLVIEVNDEASLQDFRVMLNFKKDLL